MNSWSELAELLSQLPIMAQVNATKEQLDGIRPLPQEVEGRVMQKLRLEWNYHSNAIEGNKLTFGETYSFLMYGLTAKGKPFKDHLDIKGHNEAINFLTSLIKDDFDLTEVDIRNLHKMILVEPYQSPAQTADGQAITKTIRIGEYKQQPNHVKTPTGEIHYFATPEETPIKMHELVQWYNEARKNSNIHPSVLAAFVHHRFVNIHPFDDGNGRLARILMNLILMKNGYPPAVVKLKERTDYYQALNQADRNEYVPLVDFLAEAVLDSMNLYLKAARGESIEDDADLDKEIALFKGSFEKTYEIKNKETIAKMFEQIILPIVKIAEIKFSKLDDLFYKREETLYYAHKHLNYSKSFSDDNLINVYEDKTQFIAVQVDWLKFNKILKNMDFNTNLRCHLGDKAFSIEYSNSSIFLLEKYYGEPISDFEKEKAASDWFRLTFEDLKKKIEDANKV